MFTQEALHEVVKYPYVKKTGARGLRSVLEASLIPIMFETPSRDDVREVMVTKETILGQTPPIFSLKKDKKIA